MGVHGCSCMRYNFQNVVPPHGPWKVKDLGATIGVVDFLSVSKDEAFAGREGPDECDVVFFAAACRSCFSCSEWILISESESPIVIWIGCSIDDLDEEFRKSERKTKIVKRLGKCAGFEAMHITWRFTRHGERISMRLPLMHPTMADDMVK